jgi:hypothetical protein
MNKPTNVCDALNDYVKRIRNPYKKDYASEYAHFAITGGAEPPDRGPLSYMAAQAVRMNIKEIVNGEAK